MLLKSKGLFALAVVGLAFGCSPVYSTATDPAPTYRAGTAYGPPGGGATSYRTPPAASYANTQPPAPLAESIPARPYDGAVWVDGYWHWNDSEWIWISGRWMADREDHVYVEPYYDYSYGGGYCAYVPGYWTHSSYIPSTVVVINNHHHRPRRVRVRPRRHARNRRDRKRRPRRKRPVPSRHVDLYTPKRPIGDRPDAPSFDRFDRNKNPHRPPPRVPVRSQPDRTRAITSSTPTGDRRAAPGRDHRRPKDGARNRDRRRSRTFDAPDRNHGRDRVVGRPDRPLPRRDRMRTVDHSPRPSGAAPRGKGGAKAGNRTIVVIPSQGGRRAAPRGNRRAAPRGDRRAAPRGQRAAPRGQRRAAPRGQRAPRGGQRAAPRGQRAAPRGQRAPRGNRAAPRGQRAAPRSGNRGGKSSSRSSSGNRSKKSSGSRRSSPSKASRSRRR